MSEIAERLTVLISDAGRGIGRTTLGKLLSHGYTVGVLDISGDQKWAADRQNAVVSTLDVTNPQQWEDALKQFVDRAGRLDVLINSASTPYGTPLEEGSYEQNNALVDVNVKGVHFGCRAALPYLRGSRGQVINLCSASAIYDTPDMATYPATKFVVHGITETLEVEWEPHGVDVKAVWPFYVSTPILKNVSTDDTKRMGIRITPDDVANAIVNRIDHKQGKITKAHFPIGLQTKLLYYAASVGTPFLNRFISAKLTTKRKIGL